MAYAAVSIPAYTAASASMPPDIAKERSKMRRSYSDNHLCHAVTAGGGSIAVEPKLKSSRSMGIFPFAGSISILPESLRSFLFDPETSKDMDLEEKENRVDKSEEGGDDDDDDHNNDVKRANWVERLMEIKRHWRNKVPKKEENMDNKDHVVCVEEKNDEHCDDDVDGVCMVGCDDDEEEEGEEEEEEEEALYNRESFSKYLVRVPWSDTKHYSQLAFLCNMAYVIPQIKAKDLRRHYGLKFVTSSLERKAEVGKIKAKLEQDSSRVPTRAMEASNCDDDDEQIIMQACAAYEIAASAASYVQSRAKSEEEMSCSRVYKSEVAAYMAASTVTAVVAAGEREKQEAAKDLQSLHSSPCEWFVCDDSTTYTRRFVIQGSDSLASWQANLFFEPTKFEGTDVLVHRGIYEAAKGIYEQFMPEIMEHLRTHGARAKLQFTGHSLGGSLSLLVHLMLLTRKVVSPSTLRPVVTFGSPFVFCGGKKILNQLGVDESNINCVIMHRDIVPRAFSCNYPNHVALLLKRLNASFRSHPCLMKKKLLYSPLGKILIVQPEEKTSPSHPLLPVGSGVYTVEMCPNVVRAFLNRPHPLETLSDPTAYGSQGTILRDHDSSNYLKALNTVLRQHTKLLLSRRVNNHRINHLSPFLASHPYPQYSWTHTNTNYTFITNHIITEV